jgi:exopolysaccharide biosynthesis protein
VIYSFPEPTPNTTSVAAAPPTPDYPAGARIWDVTDAIGAGPTLISEGGIVNTYEQEVFFRAGFTNIEPYPRAAVGYTADNHLILFATDGKQPTHSVGLSLPQLAEEMLRLGCMEALNLDGGGSETLVVNGLVLNRPAGISERPVTSMLAIIPANSSAGK